MHSQVVGGAENWENRLARELSFDLFGSIHHDLFHDGPFIFSICLRSHLSHKIRMNKITSHQDSIDIFWVRCQSLRHIHQPFIFTRVLSLSYIFLRIDNLLRIVEEGSDHLVSRALPIDSHGLALAEGISPRYVRVEHDVTQDKEL